MPASIRKDRAKLVTDNDTKVDKANKFPTLLKFLLSQKRAIEYDTTDLRLSTTSFKSAAHHVTTQEQTTYKPAVKQQNSSAEGRTLRKCLIHENSDHWTDECRAYLTKPTSERIEVVKKRKACWYCLKTGHVFRDCKRKRNCGENGCTRKHNKSLHNLEEDKNRDTKVQENNSNDNKIQDGKQEFCMSACNSLTEDTCLLQFQKIRTPKGFVNVMWDNGSSLCFITNKKAKELKLTGKKATLTIVRVGGKTEILNSCKYELPLIDTDGQIVKI